MWNWVPFSRHAVGAGYRTNCQDAFIRPIVSHDANKTTYEVWPKPKPTKKKKKARPRIPKGPLVAAALAAADDAGTRHHVQDIYFAYTTPRRRALCASSTITLMPCSSVSAPTGAPRQPAPRAVNTGV